MLLYLRSKRGASTLGYSPQVIVFIVQYGLPYLLRSAIAVTFSS